MKCLSCFLAALWCAAAIAPARAQSPAVSVRIGAGFLYGVAKEFVFSYGYTKSELDWQFEPVFFQQTSLDVRASSGLHASVQVRAGIPMQSGIMTDSDWMNVPASTAQTNFSQSNCFTNGAILIDARVGWELAAGDGFRLEPFLSGSYMSWHWSARDGYLQYPPGSTPVPIYGTGIIYDQTYLIPGLGVRGSLRLSAGWEITGALTVSPWLYCVAFDTHRFTGYDYADTMWGGWMIEPEVDAVLSLSPRAALSLEVSYRHIGNLVGTDTEIPTGTGAGTQTAYADAAGAGYDALAVALAFSLAF